jgi:fatty-acyl-CoA synthase
MRFDSFHRTNIGDLISTQAARIPDRPFLHLDEERLTYGDVDRKSTALAGALRGLSLDPGDRLAVVLPNSPAFVVSMFAASKAGLVLVPINIRRSPSEMLSRLVKTNPRALITFSNPERFRGVDHLAQISSMRSEIPALETVVSQDASNESVLPWSDLLRTEYADALPRPDPDLPAAIIHTLGSYGQPRGAILSHYSLVRNAADIASILACDENDVFLGAVPFSNTFGLTASILACTIAGAQIVCMEKFHPEKALELICRHKVTVHHGVPTMFGMELNYRDFDPARCESLRTGIVSGAHCPPILATRVRQEMSCSLILAYGLTEASPSVAMTRLDDGPITATETVGRPMPDVELKVIDNAGTTLEHGREGELCVRGYNVMMGYWDDPQATSQVLDADGWLRTSDLAIVDPDGPVRIVGRKDEVIIRGGFKMYPGKVEMVLRSFPGVKEAAVVGVPDLIFGELAVACIVPQSGATVQVEDLLSYASSQLADYAIPDRVLFFDALPRRSSGTVRKGYLRERARIRGRAWRFGKNIDTDAIIPARH